MPEESRGAGVQWYFSVILPTGGPGGTRKWSVKGQVVFT